MKNIWLLLKSNLKRNWIAVFLSVFGGFILCFLLQFMGNYTADVLLAKVKVGVIDYDKSSLSGNFKSYLTRDLDYELIEKEDYEYLSRLLIDKDISVIIEIPEGFNDKFAKGETGKITVTSTDDYENAAFLKANINSYFTSIRLLSVSSAGDKDTFTQYLSEFEQNKNTVYMDKAYKLDQKKYKQKEGFRYSIGFYLMIVFAMAMILSYVIVDDRRSGIYDRITITYVKPVQYIAGNSLFGFLLLLAETLIYCGFIAIMKINIGFPVYKLFFLYLLFSFFVICFVIDVSLLLKSKNGILMLVMSYSTIGALLGGSYFSIDTAPENLQNFAKIMPHYWTVDALSKLMDNPNADITVNIIIVVLFTILAFLIGAVLFSQNSKRV